MDKNINQHVLKIITSEFYFLTSQFGQVMAVGWENPYRGWLVEEIEADQQKAFAVSAGARPGADGI